MEDEFATIPILNGDAFEQSIVKVDGDKVTRDMGNMRAKLLVRTMCDADNKRLFTDKDIDLLGGKASAAIDKAFEIAQKLNRMRVSDKDELEKNSE